MPDRKPDSQFPGRDTYGRRRRSAREGSNLSLLIAGGAALLFIIAAWLVFGI